jgi:hypothetical protein
VTMPSVTRTEKSRSAYFYELQFAPGARLRKSGR